MVSGKGKQFFSSVTTTYLGVASTITVAMLTSSRVNYQIGALLLVVALLPVLCAEYYISYRPSVKTRDKQLSTFFEDYLETVEHDVEQLADDGTTVRANIMRPTSSIPIGSRALSIAFTHDEDQYRDGELDLEFDSGQGCVGKTFSTGQQNIAIWTDVEGWSDGYGTTDVQNRVTSHLSVVVGTPVYRPGDDAVEDDPVAVLIVDSEDSVEDLFGLDESQELENVDLKQSELATLLTNYSRNVGILL